MAPEPTPGVLAIEVRQAQPIPLDLAFACRPGEVVALFGPSGSGKTTVLRTIAGLYRPATARVASGQTVWCDTASGTFLPTHRRACGLVFQDYALFPHMTVRANVAAAMGHRPRHERPGRASQLLDLVHLGDLADRRPSQLSGGQRQRVALARALARDPAVLLLDEPFAAIDRRLRAGLYAELEMVRSTLGVPIVLVTHDFEEVARLADRVVVIERGAEVAQGPLLEISGRRELAQLGINYDPGTLLEARIVAHAVERRLTLLSFPGGELWSPQLDLPPGSMLRVHIPAREVTLCLDPPADISTHNVLPATVSAVDDGPDRALALVRLQVGTTPLLAGVTRDAVSRLGLVPGKEVHALIKSVAVLRPG